MKMIDKISAWLHDGHSRRSRKSLTDDDRLRAVEEARLAEDRLGNLKATSRSFDNPAGQQPGAGVGTSKVQRAAEDAAETETPQQREREEFGTEL
jgi:hypothetical protein